MTTYRQDLGAAQLRIAHLERELADRDTTIRALREPPKSEGTETTSEASSTSTPTSDEATEVASPTEAMSILDAWPALGLAGIGIGYLLSHGARAPDDVVSWALVSGGAAAVLLTLSKAIRWRNGGESSIADRVLMVLGYVVGTPFALGACAFAMPIVGGLIGAGSLVAAIGGAVLWAWRFVVTGRD